MEFALWNRAAARQLIERECGLKLSVRGAEVYLARWGFTPKKPSNAPKPSMPGWTPNTRPLPSAAAATPRRGKPR